MFDGQSDRKPFSIQVAWGNHSLELLVMPEWCYEKSEMRFGVYLREKMLGIIGHENIFADGWIWHRWVWLKGNFDDQGADLIGQQIDNCYL